MVFLVSLLIGTQILCSLAGYPAHRESPPPPPDRLISPPCNTSSVKAAAELALDKLNEHRREGYILGLQRIFDVRQLQWQGTGFVYYLTLDVLETNCHVRSRKSWKHCMFRTPEQMVYGQCKATFYINKPGRILHLFSYDCVLHTVPASAVTKFCPLCPTPADPTEPRYLEAAAQSLARFNEESKHAHYFNLRNVTKAQSQKFINSSVFVEYIIQETSCSKGQAVADPSRCSFLPDETADMGVCTGVLLVIPTGHQNATTAQCNIFHQKPQAHDRQQIAKSEPGLRGGDESREGDGHAASEKTGYRDHQHQRHHPRDHRQRDPSQELAEHEQQPPTAGPLVLTAPLEKTMGRVKTLPSSDTHESPRPSPETEAEQLDGIPVPPESQGPKPAPSLPDIHGAPEGSRPLDKPGLTKPAAPLSPPPFPAGFSQSNTCPGEILVPIYGPLEPLLPKRPAELPPTGPPEFQAKQKA